MKKYPGWSEFLASFAAVLLVGILIFPIMRRMNTKMFVGVACISCIACYFSHDRIHNSWLALLIGSCDYITFPVLQYGVFFAAGVLFCKKKIKWNVWILLGTVLAGIPCIVAIIKTVCCRNASHHLCGLSVEVVHWCMDIIYCLWGLKEKEIC